MPAAKTPDEVRPSAREPIELWYQEKGWSADYLAECRFNLRREKAEPGLPAGHAGTYHGDPPTEEIIARDHGRGLYDLSVLHSDEQGNYAFAGRRYVQISGPARPVQEGAGEEGAEEPVAVQSIRAKAEATSQEVLLKHVLSGSGGPGQAVLSAIERTADLRVEMARHDAEQARSKLEQKEKELDRMAQEHVTQVANIIANFNAQVTELQRQNLEREKQLHEHYKVLMGQQQTQLVTGHGLEKAAIEREVASWRARAEAAEREAKEARQALQERLQRDADVKDPAAALSSHMGLLKKYAEFSAELGALKGEDKEESWMEKLEGGLSIVDKYVAPYLKKDDEGKKELSEGQVPRETIVKAANALAGAFRNGLPPEQAAAMALSLGSRDDLGKLVAHDHLEVLKRLADRGLLPEDLRSPAAAFYVGQVWAAVRGRLAA